MDQKLMEQIKACKSSDEIKALLNKRKPLSEDELDNVVGGSSAFLRNQDVASEKDLNSFVYDFIASIERICGPDATAKILEDFLLSKQFSDYYRSGGLDALHHQLMKAC